MPSLDDAISLLRSGDWEAAHEIVQADSSPLGSWGHGIVHIMEGDVTNAEYWYRKAGRIMPQPVVVSTEIEALKHALDDESQLA
jgi:hypothetical protein